MKQVWGITMCKDEGDVIFQTLLHQAEEGMDGIIVADNMSTDNTVSQIKSLQDLLEGSSCKVILIEDKEAGYYQSRKMTALARLAHEQGAEWILPFDSDELFFASNKAGDFLRDMPDHVNIVHADLYNHFGSALDLKTGNPFQNIVYRQKEKGALPKVAFRWHESAVIGQGNHSVQIKSPHAVTGLEIRHFPYRSWEHFKRKALNGLKAYEATDLPENLGGHWRQYGKLIRDYGDDVVKKEVYEKWFWFFSPVDNGMIYDPAPFRRWNK